MLSTQEVLDVTRSAEAEPSKTMSTTMPKIRKARKFLESEADGEVDVVFSDSGSECIVVSMRG